MVNLFHPSRSRITDPPTLLLCSYDVQLVSLYPIFITHYSPDPPSLPILLYLVDAFTFAASAVAAASTFRSLLGFAFPLFGSQMFEKLTVGWGCTVCTFFLLSEALSRNLTIFFGSYGQQLLAGLAIVIGIPFPIWLYLRGEDMRKSSLLAR